MPQLQSCLDMVIHLEAPKWPTVNLVELAPERRQRDLNGCIRLYFVFSHYPLCHLAPSRAPFTNAGLALISFCNLSTSSVEQNVVSFVLIFFARPQGIIVFRRKKKVDIFLAHCSCFSWSFIFVNLCSLELVLRSLALKIYPFPLGVYFF